MGGTRRSGGPEVSRSSGSTFVALRLRDGKIEQALAFLSRAEALEAAGLSEWAMSEENVHFSLRRCH